RMADMEPLNSGNRGDRADVTIVEPMARIRFEARGARRLHRLADLPQLTRSRLVRLGLWAAAQCAREFGIGMVGVSAGVNLDVLRAQLSGSLDLAAHRIDEQRHRDPCLLEPANHRPKPLCKPDDVKAALG